MKFDAASSGLHHFLFLGALCSLFLGLDVVAFIVNLWGKDDAYLPESFLFHRRVL